MKMEAEAFTLLYGEETGAPFVFRLPTGLYTIACDESGKTQIEFISMEYGAQ